MTSERRAAAPFLVVALTCFPIQLAFGQSASAGKEQTDLTAIKASIPLDRVRPEDLSTVVASIAENAFRVDLHVGAGSTIRSALQAQCAEETLDSYISALAKIDPGLADALDVLQVSAVDVAVPPCPELPTVKKRVEKGDTVYDFWRQAVDNTLSDKISITFQKYKDLFRQANKNVPIDSLNEGQTVALPTNNPALSAELIVPSAAAREIVGTLERASHGEKSIDFGVPVAAAETHNVGVLETEIDDPGSCAGASEEDASGLRELYSVLAALRDNTSEHERRSTARILIGDTGLLLRQGSEAPLFGEIFSRRTVEGLSSQGESFWSVIAADRQRDIAHHGTYVGTQALGGRWFAPISNYVLPELTISFLKLDTIDVSNQLRISEINAVKLFSALDHDIQVINLSVRFDEAIAGDAFLRSLKEANDVLFIAAAGNVEGRNIDSDGAGAYPASYSKDLGNVVGVAAVDRNGALADFSSFGPESVQIAAVGCGVPVFDRVDDSGAMALVVKSGTSLAAPKVAWAAGVMRVLGPRLSPEQIRNRLIYSANLNPISSEQNRLADKVMYGAVLNAPRAVSLNKDVLNIGSSEDIRGNLELEGSVQIQCGSEQINREAIQRIEKLDSGYFIVREIRQSDRWKLIARLCPVLDLGWKFTSLDGRIFSSANGDDLRTLIRSEN